ncbi:hypothetical protein LZ31DRAFT_213525 [Colletotrichum somersetense]|nr:hypothetical protein LZ31DRAFT_213525 [Colletotrichum somersetense]
MTLHPIHWTRRRDGRDANDPAAPHGTTAALSNRLGIDGRSLSRDRLTARLLIPKAQEKNQDVTPLRKAQCTSPSRASTDKPLFLVSMFLLLSARRGDHTGLFVGTDR